MLLPSELHDSVCRIMEFHFKVVAEDIELTIDNKYLLLKDICEQLGVVIKQKQYDFEDNSQYDFSFSDPMLVLPFVATDILEWRP